MPTERIVSIIADDRPGLVQRLSSTLSAAGGNWVDSSMARLGGQFAGIVRVSLPDERMDDFAAGLDALRGEGMEVSIRDNTPTAPVQGTKAHLDLTGGDHPGIVHDISTALARYGVSIQELKTEVFVGSMSGSAMFSAKAELILPSGLAQDDLLQDLEAIAHDIMVEIHLTPVE